MNSPEHTAVTDSAAPQDSLGQIHIRGARQHNLKNLDVDIATGQLTVVTGVSGSGKSSLVFDTLFAEGQRRYVETFSAYARQFLDRMDKPAVDRLDGVPPAIAIGQSNPVRSSRSTVGTMTELNDHFKLLFARAASLFDQDTGQQVQKDSLESIQADLAAKLNGQTPRVQITFPLPIPAGTSSEQMQAWLQAGGFTKVLGQRQTREGQVLDVVADRFRWGSVEPQRLAEALEAALRHGGGRLMVRVADDGQEEKVLAYSTGLHCPESDRTYLEPTPALFSFNSAHGACPTCRGFGRVIGVDMGLVIPNPKLTLRAGAIKPMQTPAWKEAQDDLMRHAEAEGIPRDTPFNRLTPEQQEWVINGSPLWKGQWNKQWFGVRRFFEYLESKAYKMHIRVLLSKYRSYTPCPTCAGARLQTESLLWRVGSKALADSVLAPEQRFMPQGLAFSRATLEKLPGLCLHDVMQLPIGRLQAWMQGLGQELGRYAGTIKKEAAQADLTVLNADLMPKNPVIASVAKQSTAAEEAAVTGGLPRHFAPRNDATTADTKALSILLEEIQTRLKYLVDVGLGYLSLDRQSRTLSGGEVQRINLTTALGTSLVNTLFVLDEPSIGLHPRDMQRINQAMLRLRDAGNTLVVVEHDPAVMQVADRIIDMGPGPGAAGGQMVFDGKPSELAQADTLTGAYLGGRKTLGLGFARAVAANTPKLLLQGVRANNLQNIDVEIPLQRLVCITGVSGSGKSTLVQDVLAPALLRHFGKQTDAPGEFDELLGAEQLADVVFVDQSPIGKTARSNPASYVGAWDAIREIFAASPLAKERGYTRATFSFNTGDGRCPTCGGSGFEHVEMQFLSDVYLRCDDCLGQRYRPQVLEVTVARGEYILSVADCLELTVGQALQIFADDAAVQLALQPLVDVGLDYVQLGQPVPTLSGGEAQRLKIAGHLAENAKSSSASRQNLARKGTLFLLDEPTTGLHFDDIAKLMRALRKLQDAGHTLVLIEHNLDVMAASDWLIDLGPEAGADGGRIVAQGSPADVREYATGHTADALRAYAVGQANWGVNEAASLFANSAKGGGHEAAAKAIQVINATEHNLQHLSVNIPRGQMNVITGVSGSGKSTLAFDIVFSEGQRRYLESLNAYARSIVQPPARPEVDAVYGIAPTVAIEQRLSRGGRKSTVGTATEVWHFLRLLFVKLGVQHCVHDGAPVQPQSREQISADILQRYAGQHIGLLAPLVSGRKGVYTELAAWAKKLGHSHLRVDGAFLPTQGFPRIDRFKEHQIELPIADVWVCEANAAFLRLMVDKALQLGKGVVQVLAPLDGLAQAFAAQDAPLELGLGLGIGHIRAYSTERACPVCHSSYEALDPRLFSYNSKHGWCPDCVGTGLLLDKAQRKQLDESHIDAKDKGREQSFAETEVEGLSNSPCPTCSGTRLNAIARGVRFTALLEPEQTQEVTITQLAQLSVQDLHHFFSRLRLTGRAADIARDLLPEITSRLAFMLQVGLGYLTLDRGAPTLSGGEAQRIRLAAQLGSNLQGVCYVLDEPTIGLHPRDNQILLGALRQLTIQGNTLMVVEHDEDTIRQADHIIDIGPGAGKRGGQLVAQGSVAEVAANPASTTGRYLGDASRYQFASCSGRFDGLNEQKHLEIQNAHLHNLQNLSVAIPLQQLVVVTGVSGSGKSTLARDVLLANVQAAINSRGAAAWQYCAAIEGWQQIDRVLEVDQTPIGKTPRSCPATYIGFWDVIRKLFAETLEAKSRGYTASRFSFNTGAGRCPACEGQGMRTVAMSFLPDVKVPCEVCNGARFNPQTLGVQWRGKSVGDVLHMEVDEALVFFASMPAIAHPLQLLHDVGLGYLQLGQASPTLSGGEAQRLKLVTELAKVRDDVTRRGQKAPHTLYVLDEPTVGLHMADVQRIIAVLHRLVAAGHSVVVVEHDLDLITKADWLIDMGPEGGAGGGQVLAQGRPQDLAKVGLSHTGQALAAHTLRAA